MLCRQTAVDPGHESPGMRSGSAEKYAPNRRFVAAGAEQRPHGVQLIGSELAVEDVPAGKPVIAVQLRRRDDLGADDRGPQARGVVFQRRRALASGSVCRIDGQSVPRSEYGA